MTSGLSKIMVPVQKSVLGGPAWAGLGRPLLAFTGLAQPGLARAGKKCKLAWPGLDLACPGRPRLAKFTFPSASTGLNWPGLAQASAGQPGPAY